MGYSASLIGRSANSEAELLAIAWRITSVFRRKPSLAQYGASIVTSVLRPKLVHVLTFAKTSPTAVEAIESGFGDMLCSAMSVVRGYPRDVMAGAPEYEGSGYSRLATEVTKTRLRLFQSMCVSRFVSENDLGRAMTYLAQRWSGASTPVSMLHANDLRLLLPLNRSAPQAAHMFTSSGSLGLFSCGWVAVQAACVGRCGDIRHDAWCYWR